MVLKIIDLNAGGQLKTFLSQASSVQENKDYYHQLPTLKKKTSKNLNDLATSK